jgi:hypothetical protein
MLKRLIGILIGGHVLRGQSLSLHGSTEGRITFSIRWIACSGALRPLDALQSRTSGARGAAVSPRPLWRFS